MKISYIKLWHILLDKGMKKKDLQVAAEITDYTMRKLNNDEDVSVAVLGKIALVLGCDISDLIELK